MIGTLQQTISRDQAEIIKTVLYFDIFNYPLTRDELFENAAVNFSREIFEQHLNDLVEKRFLKQDNEFILSVKGGKGNVSKRLAGNENAGRIMPTAYKYSRLIASFPFVEGVCLSGSLSKKYYDEKSDIDFFIITKPGRLWICRTLLILRYKLLSKPKKKYWCTNYFISSDSLAIGDINAFTSTELAYLIPVINYKIYTDLLKENSWYKNEFPNKPSAPSNNCLEVPGSFIKTCFEKILGGNFGAWLDNKLLYVTLRHWQKKYPDLAAEDFELQFRSRKTVCKRHTRGFQNKVLKTWDEKQKEYESHFNIVLK
jgi:hypothetical protein